MIIDIAKYLTDRQRGDCLRSAFAQMPLIPLDIPAGYYDTGEAPLMFPGVPVRACGGSVHLYNSAVWTPEISSAFVLQHGTQLSGLNLECTCPKNHQGVVLGFGFDSATPRKATLTDCTLTGGSWGCYLWHADLDEIDFLPGSRGNVINAANVGIVLGRSSGIDGQIVRVGAGNALTINIDPSLSTQGGSVTNPTDGGSMAFAVRGGQLYVDTLTANVQGQDVNRGPQCVAIQDHLEGSAPCRIQVRDLRASLKAGPGTTNTAEIDLIGAKTEYQWTAKEPQVKRKGQ